jgi:hypothetical protein
MVKKRGESLRKESAKNKHNYNYIISHQAIVKDSEQALASEHWLNLSSESMLDFLQSGRINVLEEQLVLSVVQWGKFQVEADGGDPQDGQILRAKILPALKQIRFAVVDRKNFAVLCHRELLGPVLSVGEKLALAHGNADLIPADFCRSRCDRSYWNTACVQLHFETFSSTLTGLAGAKHSTQLKFKINKRATMSEPICMGSSYWRLIKSELRDVTGKVVIKPEDFEHSNYALAADTYYTLDMSFDCLANGKRSFQTYQLPANTTVTRGWITVTTDSLTMFVDVSELEISFDKAFSYP